MAEFNGNPMLDLSLVQVAEVTDIIERERHGGNQLLARLSNGYGASIVNHVGSYGTELAVITFDREGISTFNLVYDTPVTNDVIGHIEDFDELNGYLIQIANLPEVVK